MKSVWVCLAGALTFSIAALLADYRGVWNTDAKVWVGTLTQNGLPMKLTMTRGAMPGSAFWRSGNIY